MKPRLLIVDDVKRLRDELRVLLEKDFDVVGEADNGAAAVEASRQHRPQLIVMDVVMPKMSGIEATRILNAEAEAPKIVMLSGLRDEHVVLQALEAGACDYLFKPVDVEKLRKVLLGFLEKAA